MNERVEAMMMVRRQVSSIMKHKQQMSLIARRAQIRRAAASRRDQLSAQRAGRPMLRLVTTAGHDTERDQRSEHREQVAAVD